MPTMTEEEKRDSYRSVAQAIAGAVAPTKNTVSRMATVSCLLSEAFPHYYWTGFYLVDPDVEDQLIVGPYQGTMGCLIIPFGKGVCGTAAATGETQVVEDVHAFEGHIACDTQTNSEIVVPVYDAAGKLMAVFDVDSTEPASFDSLDKECLEDIMAQVFATN